MADDKDFNNSMDRLERILSAIKNGEVKGVSKNVAANVIAQARDKVINGQASSTQDKSGLPGGPGGHRRPGWEAHGRNEAVSRERKVDWGSIADLLENEGDKGWMLPNEKDPDYPGMFFPVKTGYASPVLGEEGVKNDQVVSGVIKDPYSKRLQPASMRRAINADGSYGEPLYHKMDGVKPGDRKEAILDLLDLLVSSPALGESEDIYGTKGGAGFSIKDTQASRDTSKMSPYKDLYQMVGQGRDTAGNRGVSATDREMLKEVNTLMDEINRDRMKKQQEPFPYSKDSGFRGMHDVLKDIKTAYGMSNNKKLAWLKMFPKIARIARSRGIADEYALKMAADAAEYYMGNAKASYRDENGKLHKGVHIDEDKIAEFIRKYDPDNVDYSMLSDENNSSTRTIGEMPEKYKNRTFGLTPFEGFNKPVGWDERMLKKIEQQAMDDALRRQQYDEFGYHEYDNEDSDPETRIDPAALRDIKDEITLQGGIPEDLDWSEYLEDYLTAPKVDSYMPRTDEKLSAIDQSMKQHAQNMQDMTDRQARDRYEEENVVQGKETGGYTDENGNPIFEEDEEGNLRRKPDREDMTPKYDSTYHDAIAQKNKKYNLTKNNSVEKNIAGPNEPSRKVVVKLGPRSQKRAAQMRQLEADRESGKVARPGQTAKSAPMTEKERKEYEARKAKANVKVVDKSKGNTPSDRTIKNIISAIRGRF